MPVGMVGRCRGGGGGGRREGRVGSEKTWKNTVKGVLRLAALNHVKKSVK